jgi:hypothetical protein
MNKFILITTLYDVKSDFRLKEIHQTILANIENSYIKKIIIFFENYNNVSSSKYKFLQNDKIHIVDVDPEQTYKMLFNYANYRLKDEVVIVSKIDILFDDTLIRLNEIDFNSKYICVLTKWDVRGDNYILNLKDSKSTPLTFDSYIFKTPIEYKENTLDIKVNDAECYPLLINRLLEDNLFTITNPSLDIRSYHIDKFNKNKTYDINNIYVKRRDIKVISFSLWGSEARYNVGSWKNAELALTMYPKWECWFYIHTPTVPKETINKLKTYPNVKIIEKSESLTDISSKPMMWRFEPIDDPHVSIMLSRDTDTRFLLREKYAVNEWLESGKTFHIMRDHPHHSMEILGGMFGTKKIKKLPRWKDLYKNFHRYINQTRDYDQYFLKKYIYPIIKSDCLVHTSFHRYDGEDCRKFPVEYNNYHHVGEYVYEDDSRSKNHIIELKNNIQNYDSYSK